MEALLLRLLAKSKADEGFSLIELLVTVVIIGILAAIALPSMLSQADKARVAEGKSNIGAINNAQAVYRTEHQAFATSLDDLHTGIQNTANYSYALGATDPTKESIANATPEAGQPGVAGRVYVNANRDTVSFFCVGTPGDLPNVATAQSEKDCPSTQ